MKQTSWRRTIWCGSEGSESPMIASMRWLCGFAVIFSGFLFATKPATNEAQLIFRIALFVGGLTGLLVLWLRGRRKN